MWEKPLWLMNYNVDQVVWHVLQHMVQESMWRLFEIASFQGNLGNVLFPYKHTKNTHSNWQSCIFIYQGCTLVWGKFPSIPYQVSRLQSYTEHAFNYWQINSINSLALLPQKIPTLLVPCPVKQNCTMPSLLVLYKILSAWKSLLQISDSWPMYVAMTILLVATKLQDIQYTLEPYFFKVLFQKGAMMPALLKEIQAYIYLALQKYFSPFHTFNWGLTPSTGWPVRAPAVSNQHRLTHTADHAWVHLCL